MGVESKWCAALSKSQHLTLIGPSVMLSMKSYANGFWTIELEFPCFTVARATPITPLGRRLFYTSSAPTCTSDDHCPTLTRRPRPSLPHNRDPSHRQSRVESSRTRRKKPHPASPSPASTKPSTSHMLHRPPPHNHKQEHTAPPSHLIGRPSAKGASGPPNSCSNETPLGSPTRDSGYSHQGQLQSDASCNGVTSTNTADSRNTSLHSLSTSKSPTQSAKTGITSVSGSQSSSGHDRSAQQSADSVASPNRYSYLPSNYSFRSQPSGPSYTPAHYNIRPYIGSPRVDEVKGVFMGRPIPGQPNSDSVKQHLGVYDVETSLNEVRIL